MVINAYESIPVNRCLSRLFLTDRTQTWLQAINCYLKWIGVSPKLGTVHTKSWGTLDAISCNISQVFQRLYIIDAIRLSASNCRNPHRWSVRVRAVCYNLWSNLLLENRKFISGCWRFHFYFRWACIGWKRVLQERLLYSMWNTCNYLTMSSRFYSI